METAIPIITADGGEIRIKTDKEIDAKCLNETLLTLPAKTYLELYHEMHVKIYGYPPLSVYGGCCGTLGDTEDNVRYYSEQPKVTKSFSAGE